MKPLARHSIALALCCAAAGCGASESRVWRGPRLRSGGYVTDPAYAPPVEPPPAPRMLEPMSEPMPELAPPVRPQDLQPPPAPTIRFDQELPAPPDESEESVQYTVPAPPSSMPNALYPEESRPLLEQSSAERPANHRAAPVLGEGKIAHNMRGHSTYIACEARQSHVRLLPIEPDHATSEPNMMQVQYLPVLAPVPAR